MRELSTRTDVRVALVVLAVVAVGWRLLASPDTAGHGHGTVAVEPAAADAAGRVVTVELSEFRFGPTDLEVAAGETVTFRFVNTGRIAHEAMFGSPGEQEAWAAQPPHAHGQHGGGGTAITVGPGATEELTLTFPAAGTILAGCHLPGHYEAGMVQTVHVS